MGISLFWSFGCANALLAVMTHGGTIVLQDALEPGAALALIERERCTVYYGTPNIALALAEHPDRARRDLSSLRTGAAIGPPPAMQMVMDLGVREICNVYGLTETYGNCSVTDAHDPADIRRTTVGRPLPGMEIRIVDRETRRPLPTGEVGEILVRGYVTPGYYKDPEKNAAAFDTDGFLVTGDLGALGDDGRLRFRGRIKEMVKTGGINVAPLEVEEVLLGHPAVEQAYVVGLPDRAQGRDPRRGRRAPRRPRRRARRAARLLQDGARRVQGAAGIPADAARRAAGHGHRQGAEVPARRAARARASRRERLMRILPNDWRRNVWALTLTVFISFVGFQFFSPFLPLYIRELGVTDPAKIALWAGAPGRRHPRNVGAPVAGLRPPRRPLRPQDHADPLAGRLRRHRGGDGSGHLGRAALPRAGGHGPLRRVHADGDGAGDDLGAQGQGARGDRHGAVGAAPERRGRSRDRRLRGLALRDPLRVLRDGGTLRAGARRAHRAVPGGVAGRGSPAPAGLADAAQRRVQVPATSPW